MAINQKSFWTPLRVYGGKTIRKSLRGKIKYRNYLKSALMGAQVERPSGTYTGHYSTGALYKSIKGYYSVKNSSKSQFKIEFKTDMLDYGYKLNDGYQADMVAYRELESWAKKKGINDDFLDNIYGALLRRPFRKGSGWIDDANEDFFPAIQKKIPLEVIEEIQIPVEKYIDNALRTIFRGKKETIYNRGKQL